MGLPHLFLAKFTQCQCLASIFPIFLCQKKLSHELFRYYKQIIFFLNEFEYGPKKDLLFIQRVNFFAYIPCIFCEEGGILKGDGCRPTSHEFMVGICMLEGDMAFIHRLPQGSTKKKKKSKKFKVHKKKTKKKTLSKPNHE